MKVVQKNLTQHEFIAMIGEQARRCVAVANNYGIELPYKGLPSLLNALRIVYGPICGQTETQSED